MKLIAILFSVLVSVFVLPSMKKEDKWTPLLDKDLSQWENYLSYRFKDGYNGKIPKDSLGNDIQPIGYNKDSSGVFSVLQEPGGPVLRISGEVYGCLFTRQSYENYHLRLQVKWGKDKYEPRINKLKDSAITSLKKARLLSLAEWPSILTMNL